MFDGIDSFNISTGKNKNISIFFTFSKQKLIFSKFKIMIFWWNKAPFFFKFNETRRNYFIFKFSMIIWIKRSWINEYLIVKKKGFQSFTLTAFIRIDPPLIITNKKIETNSIEKVSRCTQCLHLMKFEISMIIKISSKIIKKSCKKYNFSWIINYSWIINKFT